MLINFSLLVQRNWDERSNLSGVGEMMYDEKEMEKEHLKDMSELKKSLRTATQKDFQIINGEEPFPYSVSWAGCYDIANFQRKGDAEKFIKTFPKDPQ